MKRSAEFQIEIMNSRPSANSEIITMQSLQYWMAMTVGESGHPLADLLTHLLGGRLQSIPRGNGDNPSWRWRGGLAVTADLGLDSSLGPAASADDVRSEDGGESRRRSERDSIIGSDKLKSKRDRSWVKTSIVCGRSPRHRFLGGLAIEEGNRMEPAHAERIKSWREIRSLCFRSSAMNSSVSLSFLLCVHLFLLYLFPLWNLSSDLSDDGWHPWSRQLLEHTFPLWMVTVL